MLLGNYLIRLKFKKNDEKKNDDKKDDDKKDDDKKKDEKKKNIWNDRRFRWHKV